MFEKVIEVVVRGAGGEMLRHWPLSLLGVVLLIAVAIARTPWFKGWFGEFQVNLAAKLLLDKRHYHLIRNVTLPTEDGTTQIDHIIVSPFGVFVVETKNMNGWVFGTKEDVQWTQTFGRKSFRFQNPLRQNYKHTKTLADLLGIPHEKVTSVIVFVGNAKLKREVPPNVTLTGGYIRYIRSQTERIFSDQQVGEILQAVAEGRLNPGLATRRAHVQHVRSLVAAKVAKPRPAPGRSAEAVSVPSPVREETSAESPVCPRCGSPMVLRTAKRGSDPGSRFWGCSTYPKCRGRSEVRTTGL